MRITNSMLIDNLLRNLNTNLRRLEAAQNQLSSGKRISRPSDDPVGLVYGMRLRSNLAGLEQYLKNVEDAISWLEITDGALDSVTRLLHRARELAVYGANDTLSEDSLKALAKEAEQLAEEMRQVANTSFAGRYIFAGTKTDQPPFAADGTYQGSSTELQVEIGAGITIFYSLTGDRVFGEANVLETLTNLKEALEGMSAQKPGDLLDELDAALNHVLTMRAEVGARVNRLELVKNRLQDSHFNLTALLSETEDADMAETIIQLKTQENIYRASLAAGARIIQPSLLDFLR